MGYCLKYITLAGLIFCITVSCSEKNIPQEEEYSIYFPAGDEIFNKGTLCKLIWFAPLCALVDIELYKGSDTSYTIVEALPNQGTYYWEIPDGIPDGSNYSIKISNSEAKNLNTINNKSFEIRSTGEVSSFTDSREGQTYKIVKIKNSLYHET